MNFEWILLTFLTGLCGSYLAKKCKIPAGAMVGAIVLVTVFNLISGKAVVPAAARPVLQILGGALLGYKIGKDDLTKMKHILKPVLLLIFALIVLNISLGYGIHLICGIDLATALFAAAPGGVSDMALIADELHADTGIVSIMQLVRLFAIYLIYPSLIRRLKKRTVKGEYKNSNNLQSIKMNRTDENMKDRIIQIIFTLLAGICGGILFIWLGVPAGGMTGSVIFSCVYNLCTDKADIPENFRFYVQSGVGVLIGVQMTKELLAFLPELVLPVILMTVILIIFTLIFGWIMSRISDIDFPTCLLAVTPGGIQETSILADELGCDTPIVIVMHTVRLVFVICILPSLLIALAT